MTTRDAVAGGERVEQQAGEREVAEVVGAELQLEAVRGHRARRHHHAGVVDEDVDARVVGGDGGRRTSAPTRGREVEHPRLELRLRDVRR